MIEPATRTAPSTCATAPALSSNGLDLAVSPHPTHARTRPKSLNLSSRPVELIAEKRQEQPRERNELVGLFRIFQSLFRQTSPSTSLDSALPYPPAAKLGREYASFSAASPTHIDICTGRVGAIRIENGLAESPAGELAVLPQCGRTPLARNWHDPWNRREAVRPTSGPSGCLSWLAFDGWRGLARAGAGCRVR